MKRRLILELDVSRLKRHGWKGEPQPTELIQAIFDNYFGSLLLNDKPNFYWKGDKHKDGYEWFVCADLVSAKWADTDKEENLEQFEVRKWGE